MVQTRECDFCGTTIAAGTGRMFVRTDGSVYHFCSSKCESNFDLDRDPEETGWTRAARAAKAEAAEAAPSVDGESDTAEAAAADESVVEAAAVEAEAAEVVTEAGTDASPEPGDATVEEIPDADQVEPGEVEPSAEAEDEPSEPPQPDEEAPEPAEDPKPEPEATDDAEGAVSVEAAAAEVLAEEDAEE